MSKKQVILDEKYVNPFTDFGFKRIFGEEPNKDLLIHFLNEILRGRSGIIKDITYLKNEHLSTTSKERKCIFDIYCVNDRGERFIVELQKAQQKFFKDRAVYYSTFPIREQADRGDWNFELQAVYTIAILDFVFDDSQEYPEEYRTNVKLMDEDRNKIFYDKLTFICFEMPKFTKGLDELNSTYEKWLYLLRHLHQLDSIPAKFQDRIFKQLFEVAEIAKFNTQQVRLYEDSLKEYRDWKNILNTAIEKEHIQIAINLLKRGISVSDIATATMLSKEEIENLST